MTKEDRQKKLAVAVDKTVKSLESSDKSDWPALLEKLLGYAIKLPTFCSDCQESLDPRIRDRCPKHAGVEMAKGFLADKIKLHGPTIAMKAMSKASETLDQWLGDPTAKDEDNAD